MPKAPKSSASAGTRKKHAKKATKGDGDAADSNADGPGAPQRKPQRGEKKLSKAQKRALPKVKSYVPPPKPPAPPIPDPLDGQGLARTLPAELVVVLRRLGKKDDVTRRKGLEELKEEWVGPLLAPVGETGDGTEAVDREIKEMALLDAVPVWLHNLSSLLVSPFHRTLAIQLHSDLLSLPSIRTSVVNYLSLGLLPGTQNRDVLGSWLIAVLEEGRRASAALRTWEECTNWSPASTATEGSTSAAHIDLREQVTTLIEYFSLAILDPPSLHDDIHPLPVASTPAPTPQKNAKGAKAKTPFTPPQPTPAAEDQSVLDERIARHRVGGLTGLAWLITQLSKHGYISPPPELTALIGTRALWSSLSSLEDDAEEVFGFAQPTVRRAAYLLLDALIEAYPDTVGTTEMLEMLSVEVLGCCWKETEATVWSAGVSVVKFLSKHRQAWEIAMRAQEGESSQARSPKPPAEDGAEDGDADGTDEDEDEDDMNGDEGEDHAEASVGDSHAFAVFLEFIATICPTIPHLTYPLLLVVISSLPDSILPLEPEPSPALETLFAHLWSPVDARLLATHALPGQPSAFQAFFQDAVDCTLFLISKALRRERGESTARWLVHGQLGQRSWKDGVMVLGGRARRRGEAAAEIEAEVFGKAVGRLFAASPDLAGELLDYVRKTLLEMCFVENEDGEKEANAYLARSLAIVAALRKTNTETAILQELDTIVGGIGQESIKRLGTCIESDPSQSVLYAETVDNILRHDSADNSQLKEALSNLTQKASARFYGTLPASLFVSLLTHLASSATPYHVTTGLWNFINSPDTPQTTRFALASAALDAADTAGLLSDRCLDAIALESATAARDMSSDVGSSIAQSALRRGAPGLSANGAETLLQLVSEHVEQAVNDIILGKTATMPSRSVVEIIDAASIDRVSSTTLLALYRLVHVVPRLLGGDSAPDSVALEIMSRLSPAQRDGLANGAIGDVAELIVTPSSAVRPRDLVDVALLSAGEGSSTTTTLSLASKLFGDADSLSKEIEKYSSATPGPSLAIIDPLVPYSTEETTPNLAESEEYDSRGFSRTARIAEAILALLRSDRSVVSSRPDLLRFALKCAVFAHDTLSVPGASRGLFGGSISSADLADLAREADGALSYALAEISDAPASWHSATIAQIKEGKVADNADFLQSILVSLANDVRAAENDVASRVLRDCLARHFRQSGAGEPEATAWLGFVMGISERTPLLSLPIILAIKPLLLDSKPFETAQNRLASSLSSIPATSASSKGIAALRLLIASAPPEDAASVFLPQQRAIFVLRHVQKWLTSDDAEELGDEIEYYLAQLYTVLAPIVQDVSGDHWDNIFDLVESALEASSLGEPTTFALLYQTLLLLRQIRDLCGSNKALRASWTAKESHLGLVLKLFLESRDAESTPIQRIQELLLDLIGDIPEKALSQASLPALCDLLRLSSSSSIQCTAYRILSRVVRANTLALVFEVEAGVSEALEGHASRTIALPSALVDIVAAGAGVDWQIEEPIHLVLGQLLAWMGILDHFDDASRTLRWAYLDQLNSSQLISTSLIPLLFGILGVSEVGAWNFPAGQYAVDEFYPDLLDPEDLPDLSPLASHLFYRSLVTLPSVMRTYYESLKDRQLSMSMLSFVSRFYAPVIIAHEFSALREPTALAMLTEEGLNVKIASGGGATAATGTGSAEAIASYVVDEQPMEIGIRLPAEFPLKGVEIRDLRRVGVPENKWRGWLMSVQQTITSRNGLILEALTVFKKNVSLHFEGVVECAICYSIISLTDRTLPTKPCRTCKNRFHASCLFKWFNSSHSSSCPMCRALF